MTFSELILLTAAEYNTTSEEIEQEMSAALIAAGIDLSPELFIASTAKAINEKLKQKEIRINQTHLQ